MKIFICLSKIYNKKLDKMKKLNLLNAGIALKAMAILLVLSITTIACNKEDDKTNVDPTPNSTNIVELAKTTPSLSTLVTALGSAGLDEVLSQDGPFTVFAPSNDAFGKLDPALLQTILDDKDMLTTLLKYHVVSGSVKAADIKNGDVETLDNKTIKLTVDGANVFVNDNSKVTTADVEASNGVVHIIDNVLIPEDLMTKTIAGIASSNDDFSILVSILSMPELQPILEAASDPASDLTVFAPTNQAFLNLLSALGKSDLSEVPVDLLVDIVKYHIASGTVMSTDLSNGQEINTLLEGDMLNVTIGSDVMIDNSKVISADIKASNGVVHVIDNVLLPDYVVNSIGKVTEFFLFNPEYSTLTKAVKIAGLFEALNTSESITLFAPDNMAFAKAGITSLNGLTADDLTPILLYHVLGLKVMSTELPADGMATTLSGDKIYLGYLTDKVLINGLTTITSVDIEKSNGVIHTIDRTLVMPAPDVVDIASAFATDPQNPQFTVLVSLLVSDDYTDILNLLKTSENLTVFAPTDEAFGNISDVIATLTTEQIAEVLKYHVVAARVFSTQLSDGQEVGMLNGQNTTVEINNGMVSLKDMSMGENSKIVQVNIHGSNGVIHVIDKVLIPQL